MHLLKFALASACLCLDSSAHAEPVAITGSFAGSGRACYGALILKASEVSWTTPFSRCARKPFHVISNEMSGSRRRLTLRLNDTSPSCRYRILALTHDESQKPDIGWEVTGYGSDASYKADKESAYTANRADMMSCPLIREAK